ncbi:MAG: hypothetical protein ABIN01_05665 [Ferruginibacter sp.]
MEFEEMKKIWDAQNNEPLYGINEKALHNRILSKKKKGHHITNISELLSIIVYAGAACFIFFMNLYKQNGSIFMYVLAAWMLCSALYLWAGRLRRINGDRRFDRSMHGDLEHAVSMATYQVHLSMAMRWNILPIALLTSLAIWNSGKSIWIVLGILIFFVLTNYAAAWEHRIYKTRKRELEILQEKLATEDLSGLPS